MATITIELGRRNAKKVRPVTFLVCQKKEKRRLPTTITVSDAELTKDGKRIKNPEKQREIESARSVLQQRLDEMSLSYLGVDMPLDIIMQRLTVNRTNLNFFEFAAAWIHETNIKGKKNYVTMLNTLEKYHGSRSLAFEDLNYGFLQGFKSYLQEKPRAQSLYLGQLRHLYREAMRKYNDDREQLIKNDPFLRFQVPRQQLKKGVRALTLEQLLDIYNYKGTGTRDVLARDCFILSFCLMGMNSVDMYECTNLQDGIIKYKRAKTKERRSDEAYIEVKVHPFIKPLMKKYRDRSRVFDFHRRYASAAAFNQNLNIGLKTVGKAVGIEGLSFYQARHTFATLSRNLMKFSKSDVDEALNHVGTLDIADVYIQKDFSIINENLEKLIDRVFGELQNK